MKLKELKHNHSLTDLLKILIFSLLMLTPILSVATRCLYVVCNKNAYESYYGETINEIIYENTSFEDLEINKKYTLVTNQDSYETKNIVTQCNIYFDNYKYIGGNTNFDNENINGIRMIKYANDTNLWIHPLINNTLQNGFNSSNSNVNIQFNYLSSNNTIDNINSYFNIEEMIYNKYSYLDNVFEYSVHSLEDNQLFNWTKNTAVYTGVNAMTSNLEIEGSVIPILITYWFLLTIIYVIIDIVLKLFTILTHMIGNKTA